MKKIKNENGYSLILTLMLVLLFLILGASLIAMTFNGATKNETRESTVQSNDLATKGEEFIIANMNLDIQNEIKKFYISKNVLKNEDFNNIFSDKATEYLCPPSGTSMNKNSKLYILNESIPEDNTNSSAEICISNIKSHLDHQTKKEVTFKSIGTVNGKKTEFYSTYLMGAQETVAALKYTISTFKNNGKGGNLFLHGGSEIKGNISVENNLFTTDYGYSYNGRDTWLESTLPSIENSHIFLGNEVQSFSNNKLTYNSDRQNFTTGCFLIFCSYLDYGNHIDSKYSDDFYRKTFVGNTIPNNIFSKTTGSILSKEQVETVFYDVNTNFDEVNQGDLSNSIRVSPSSKSFNVPNRNTTKKITKSIILIDSDYNSSIKYPSEKSKNSPLILNGDVYIKNNISVTFDRPVIIKGDLVIGDVIYDNDKPDKYNKINLKGTSLYVEGRVKIEGVNLSADANLYARGDLKNNSLINELPNMTGTTRFSYLTLSGLKTINPIKNEGSLIVFSKGELQISNISLYEDTEEASVIKGYFYSEGAMELYGFGSNLKIIGGISGNNIILNAMKGKVKASSKSTCQYINPCQKIDDYEYETASKQATSLPRLRVEYNQAILENYAKNDAGSFSTIKEDDLIKKVNLLDRTYGD